MGQFNVTSTQDTLDVFPGDGICADVVGQCTLRAAIQESNATFDDDTIHLPAGSYVLQQKGSGEDNAATGDLDILGNVTLVGGGANTTFIDGNALDRVLQIGKLEGGQVTAKPTVTISDVTIRGGVAQPTSPAGNQDRHGGGLLNYGWLTLTNVRIIGNRAAYFGGGIAHLDGTLAVDTCAIVGNIAGAVGGGIHNEQQWVSVTKSTIGYNRATGSAFAIAGKGFGAGGGLYNGLGTSMVSASTFVGNQAAFGGGLMNIGGTLFVTNSTLAENRATDSCGGAICHSGGMTVVTHSTIARNRAADKGAGTILSYPAGAGGIYHHDASWGGESTVVLTNNILAKNRHRLSPNCFGVFTSGGYNIIADDNGCALDDPADDLIGIDPLLGPLGLYGGPTPTYPLLAGSPAIDAVPLAQCIVGETPLTTDQRGVARPQGEACDIGAYEGQPVP